MRGEVRRLQASTNKQQKKKKKKAKKNGGKENEAFVPDSYLLEQEKKAHEAETRLGQTKDLLERMKGRMKTLTGAANDLCGTVGIGPAKTPLEAMERVKGTVERALDTVNRIATDQVSKSTLDTMIRMYRARKEGVRPLTVMNLHELVATMKWNFVEATNKYANKVGALHQFSKAMKQANQSIRIDVAKHVASERFLACRMDMDTHALCPNVLEWCSYVENGLPTNPREHSTFLDEIITVCCVPIRRASNVVHGVVRNHASIVTIQRYVRRWLFKQTNYRHFSMRRHTELIKLGVMKEVIMDRPMIEPCIRVAGLIEAGLVSRENAAFILDESKGMDSPYWKLKQYLQTAIEDRMSCFANTIYKTHQEGWHDRIVAGVYVPKGDPEKVVEHLVKRAKAPGAARELVERWGIDPTEASNMIARYLDVEKDIVLPGQTKRWTTSG